MGWLRRSSRERILADISFKKRGQILSGGGGGASASHGSGSGAQGAGRNMFMIGLLLFGLLIAGIFAVGYFSSEQGQRAMQDIKAGIAKWTVDPISDFFASVYSTGSEDYFSTNINRSSEKSGLELEEFRSLTGDVIPAGEAFDLIYDINYDYVSSSDTFDGTFYCSFNTIKTDPIPNELREGEIIPSAQTTIRKGSTTVCRISEEQTRDLDGAYTFFGSFSFDYETLGATLPVYFIPGEVADSLGDTDFFDAYDLDISQGDLQVVYNGEPVSVAIGVGEEGEEQQPVIVRSGDTLSYNTIGITLTNEWNGEIESLDSFELSLPEGVTLNDELNGEPSTSCPFISTGREGRTNTYIMDSSVQNNLLENYIANNAFFGKANYRTFQCWLEIDTEIFADAPYIEREYSVDIAYRYKVEEQQETISIVGAGDSLVVT